MTKTVLITGGAKRIGRALSLAFAQAGWGVVIHYNHSEGAAADLADDIREDGGEADTFGLDLSASAAIASGIATISKAHPALCALINCAAVFTEDRPQAPEAETFMEAMRVNALAPMLLSAAFVEATSGREGRAIVNILDQKLANMNPDYASYTAAKGALNTASEMMVMAFDGVTIGNVAPGLTLPSGDQTEEEFEEAARLNLLRRRTHPEEVANAAVLLASGALASGTTLYLDGGQHLAPQARDVMFLVRAGENA